MSKSFSYFKMLRQAIKDTKEQYRKLKQEKLQKEALLSSKSNWSMVEYWIQQCNNNPDLNVTIRLLDGTVVHMNCYKPVKPSMDALLSNVTIERDIL